MLNHFFYRGETKEGLELGKSEPRHYDITWILGEIRLPKGSEPVQSSPVDWILWIRCHGLIVLVQFFFFCASGWHDLFGHRYNWKWLESAKKKSDNHAKLLSHISTFPHENVDLLVDIKVVSLARGSSRTWGECVMCGRLIVYKYFVDVEYFLSN